MSDSTAAAVRSDPPSPKRVLFVAGRLEPKAPCRALIALARYLRQSGCEVEMVCRSGSIANVYPHDDEQRANEQTPPIWLSRALANNLRGWLSLAGLASRVREMNPDLLHVHGADLARVGARLARRLRKPYVLGINDFLEPGQSVSLSRRFMRKIIVTSDAVRVDLVNRIRLPRGVIQVVPEGVEVARGTTRPPGLKGFEVPVVGTIGRLAGAKGQEVFIRAAHLLAMRGRHVHFVIAGEGPDRKRLQNLVAELDLIDCVTFARGPVDQLEVLEAIDILVAPALREALELHVIEAMAAGIPVIATSAGGVFALIENKKTGILVPKNNPDALAREVEGLLDHPDVAAELASRGRQVVAENFNIQTTARTTAGIYEDILSGAPETERQPSAARVF